MPDPVGRKATDERTRSVEVKGVGAWTHTTYGEQGRCCSKQAETISEEQS